MTDPLESAKNDALLATRSWVERAVIGLGLCPFAKAVHVTGRLRYVVSDAHDEEALRSDLMREMSDLVAQPPEQLDTTLLIHPFVLTDFYDYLLFLDVAQRALKRLNLVGVLQVASFHPRYQFANTEPDALRNYSNRSPYPMLHLLRESSVTRAVEAFPDTSTIYEKNQATLEALGRTEVERLLDTGRER
ncbi:MAG: DUF1415 domain-containing protein [Polyangiaceae bacterium]